MVSRKIVELLVLYGVVPAVFALNMALIPGYMFFPVLWVWAILCFRHYLKITGKKFSRRIFFDRSEINFRYARLMLLRFVLVATAAGLYTYHYFPEYFLYLPKNNPMLWCVILFGYPFASVFPQGIIWRLYFFERYKGIVTNQKLFFILSALAFMWIHLIFGNWIALAATFLGGLMFNTTYSRTGSLFWANVEHAAYGLMLFTLGLGKFLYHGPAI